MECRGVVGNMGGDGRNRVSSNRQLDFLPYPDLCEVRMHRKQIIALITPLILIGMMVPVFQLFDKLFTGILGWYLGLVFYWVVWCGIFPIVIVGRKRLLSLILPQRPTPVILLLILFPVVMSVIAKCITGMAYVKASLWTAILMFTTPFGNGFFEEILWRGVYMELFPERVWFRIVFSGIGFALWHFAPGWVSTNSNVSALVVGSGMMGFYLGWVAHRTNTIWWGIIVHTVGGMIMIS